MVLGTPAQPAAPPSAAAASSAGVASQHTIFGLASNDPVLQSRIPFTPRPGAKQLATFQPSNCDERRSNDAGATGGGTNDDVSANDGDMESSSTGARTKDKAAARGANEAEGEAAWAAPTAILPGGLTTPATARAITPEPPDKSPHKRGRIEVDMLCTAQAFTAFQEAHDEVMQEVASLLGANKLPCARLMCKPADGTAHAARIITVEKTRVPGLSMLHCVPSPALDGPSPSPSPCRCVQARCACPVPLVLQTEAACATSRPRSPRSLCGSSSLRTALRMSTR